MADTDIDESKWKAVLQWSLAFQDSTLESDKAVLEWARALHDEMDKYKDDPEYKDPYRFNLLDLAPVYEPHTSRMLCKLLEFGGLSAEEGANYPILKQFVERFLCGMPGGSDISQIAKPHFSAEKDHFDVLIHEKGKYAILIENKIKGAKYQRNQLGRYLKRLQTEYGFEDEQIFLVIIPQSAYDSYLSDSIQKSAWRCPEDWKSANSDRRCAYKDEYLCNCDSADWRGEDYCERCTTDFYDRFSHRTTVITYELAYWLEELSNNFNDILGDGSKSEKLLKSAIDQFADYVRGLMGIRTNSKLQVERYKFIKEQVCKDCGSAMEEFEKLTSALKDLDDFKNAVEAYRKDIRMKAFEELHYEFNKEFGQKIEKDGSGYSVDLGDVKVACWDINGKPYWAIYANNEEISESARELTEEILNKSKVLDGAELKRYLYWKYSEDIEEYRSLFKAAIECKRDHGI